MLSTLRERLKIVDELNRAKSLCPDCGKPRVGLVPVIPSPARGTFKQGASFAGGTPVSKAEAGLCECPEATE
jgi:hypothetical protein